LLLDDEGDLNLLEEPDFDRLDDEGVCLGRSSRSVVVGGGGEGPYESFDSTDGDRCLLLLLLLLEYLLLLSLSSLTGLTDLFERLLTLLDLDLSLSLLEFLK